MPSMILMRVNPVHPIYGNLVEEWDFKGVMSFIFIRAFERGLEIVFKIPGLGHRYINFGFPNAVKSEYETRTTANGKVVSYIDAQGNGIECLKNVKEEGEEHA